jgi:hypothetical protein
MRRRDSGWLYGRPFCLYRRSFAQLATAIWMAAGSLGERSRVMGGQIEPW